MAELPYMPFYPADYMADAHHLSTEEHGAYFLLLITYWMKGGALPDDDRYLSRVTKLSIRKWKAARPVLEQFFLLDGVTWMHKRIELDLTAVRDKVQKARKAGLASARARTKKTRNFSDRSNQSAPELGGKKANKNKARASTDAERELRSSSNLEPTNQSQMYNPLTPLENRSSGAFARDGQAPSRSGSSMSIGDVLKISGKGVSNEKDDKNDD